jgi:hypothetical protein
MDRKARGGRTERRARKMVNGQEPAIQQRQAEVVPAAYERLCDLALDTFMRAQAVVASCRSRCLTERPVPQWISTKRRRRNSHLWRRTS